MPEAQSVPCAHAIIATPVTRPGIPASLSSRQTNEAVTNKLAEVDRLSVGRRIGRHRRRRAVDYSQGFRNHAGIAGFLCWPIPTRPKTSCRGEPVSRAGRPERKRTTTSYRPEPPLRTCNPKTSSTNRCRDFHGIPRLGSYDESWLIQAEFVPSGYVCVVASHGPNHPYNVIGFREHPNTAYQGHRMIRASWRLVR
jgi:hypothetical protein